MSMKVREAISRGTLALQALGIASARLDAELLAAHALTVSRLDLIMEPERLLDGAEISLWETCLARRVKREPVAYIIGRKEFWSLPFEVNSAVLIPRPETELLVEETLSLFSRESNPHILEVGTGSGAIAVALATELPGAHLTATDISLAALTTARKNAAINGVSGRIDFLLGDLFAPVRGEFAAIVSNAPYIAETDFALLPAGVRDYEPSLALLGGPDGLTVIRRLIGAAGAHLPCGGALLLEIGANQQEMVKDFLVLAGFVEIEFRRDYVGHWRVARGKRAI